VADSDLIQLGQGARQRKILSSATDRTSLLGERVTRDREVVRLMLHEAGVPVPEGSQVEDAEDAWATAKDIGLPVLVKPRHQAQGQSSATQLKTREEVMVAFEATSRQGTPVIVEQFVPGNPFRLLIAGGKLV